MRREGDSNSRSGKNRTAVFETAAIDHYAIPPRSKNVFLIRIVLMREIPPRLHENQPQPFCSHYEHHDFVCTPEKIRTSDLNVRNVALYPTELRVHMHHTSDKPSTVQFQRITFTAPYYPTDLPAVRQGYGCKSSLCILSYS